MSDSTVLPKFGNLITGTVDGLVRAFTTGKNKTASNPKARFVAIQLPDIDAASEKALIQALKNFGDLSLSILKDNQERRFRDLASALTPTPAIDSAQLQQEKANLEIRNYVLESTTWLTAAEIAEKCRSSSSNPNAQTSKWKREQKIFAILAGSVEKYPLYALDEHRNYRPRPAMKAIITAFGSKWSGWEIAIWFASANSFLDGKPPQEVIMVDPDLVIAAAKDKAEGILHG